MPVNFGKHTIYLDEVASTQDFAVEFLHLHPQADGVLIHAFNQYAGRGRNDHTWQSNAGKNFTGSFIHQHHYDLQPSNAWIISEATALVVKSTIEKIIGETAFIKWPNDILFSHKKIAGILIQNIWRAQSPHTSILGIGININQKMFELDHAGSLYQILNKEIPIKDIIDLLVQEFTYWFENMDTPKKEYIHHVYNESLYGKETVLQFTTKEFSFEGLIQKVHENGQIQICSRDNKINIFDLDSVKIKYR